MDVAALEVGYIELRALRVIVGVGPVADRHLHVVARRRPDQALAVRKEIGTGVLSAVVNATDVLALVRKRIGQRPGFTALGFERVGVLGLGNHVQVVGRVVRLGSPWDVRNLPCRQLVLVTRDSRDGQGLGRVGRFCRRGGVWRGSLFAAGTTQQHCECSAQCGDSGWRVGTAAAPILRHCPSSPRHVARADGSYAVE